MINFNYLYNIFQTFLTLGQTLYGWLNTSISITDGVSVPVWGIVVASGVTVGLGIKLIRSFLGN